MTPQTFTASFPQPVSLRFKVDEYYKLIELGILRDYEQAEIIDGKLVKKMTIGDRHAAVVNRLAKLFIQNVSDDVLVSVQNPLRLSEYDEPEPDFVLADLTKYDGSRHPRPAETLVVIEVSDATLRYDSTEKLNLYAEAGIREVWIVNLPKNLIEVRGDLSDGIYQTAKIFKRGDAVKSNSIEGLQIEVDKILG